MQKSAVVEVGTSICKDIKEGAVAGFTILRKNNYLQRGSYQPDLRNKPQA